MKAVLQRKCAGDGGCCDDCDKKKLQRSAIGPAPRYAPPIVHDVLRGSGEPLDRATRAAMEPRLGYDFGRVRVHRDARAAESAHAVGAGAYTVGSDVVLGRNATRDVVAHELAHVVQQHGAEGGGAIEIGRADDPLEHQADHMAVAGTSSRVLRRAPPEPEAKPAAKTQHANTAMTKTDVEKAETAAGTQTADAETIKREDASKPGAIESRFIIHDTASSVGAARIAAHVKANRGPLGPGVNAYVPRDTAPSITRPFFDKRRPTTTEFEKGLGVFAEPGDTETGSKLGDKLKARRDARFRAVWSLVNPGVRRFLIETALSGSQLTPDELKIELEGEDKKVKNQQTGKVTTKHSPGALEQLNDPKGAETIYTSATWTIELICAVAPITAFALGLAGLDAFALQRECAALAPYWAKRNELIATTNAIEIVQPGVTRKGAAAGHKNSCAVNNELNEKFKSPSYSDNQYNSARDLYLRAALKTRVFPFITTHKVIDREHGDHCDPRCFNLGRLYNDIATMLGHKTGDSLYGVEPTYGRGPTTSVWWDDGPNSICAEAKPK